MAASSSIRYWLDTNILVAYIRGNELGNWIEATYSLRTASTAPLISVVSEGEIHSLALQFGWQAGKVRALRSLVDEFVSVPVEFPRIIGAYAEIDDLCRRRGKRLGNNDVWLAATARATQTRLRTTDRDFDHLDPATISRDWIDPNRRL